MQAAGDLLEFGDRGRDAFTDAGEPPVELGRPGAQQAVERAQFQAERDEALLRAVVEVPLDPAPGLVGGGDHTSTGGLEVGPALRCRECCGYELGEAGDLALDLGRLHPLLSPR